MTFQTFCPSRASEKRTFSSPKSSEKNLTFRSRLLSLIFPSQQGKSSVRRRRRSLRQCLLAVGRGNFNACGVLCKKGRTWVLKNNSFPPLGKTSHVTHLPERGNDQGKTKLGWIWTGVWLANKKACEKKSCSVFFEEENSFPDWRRKIIAMHLRVSCKKWFPESSSNVIQ